MHIIGCKCIYISDSRNQHTKRSKFIKYSPFLEPHTEHASSFRYGSRHSKDSAIAINCYLQTKEILRFRDYSNAALDTTLTCSNKNGVSNALKIQRYKSEPLNYLHGSCSSTIYLLKTIFTPTRQKQRITIQFTVPQTIISLNFFFILQIFDHFTVHRAIESQWTNICNKGAHLGLCRVFRSPYLATISHMNSYRR